MNTRVVALIVSLASLAFGATAPTVPPTPKWLVDAAWDILKKGVASDNEDHQRQALAAVAVCGATPESLALLDQGLHAKHTLVRQTAAAALGDTKDPRAIPLLQQALDDSTEVSFTAAKALADMGDMSGAWVLREVLTGQASNVPGIMKNASREARHKLHSPGTLALMGIQEASGVLLGPASMGIMAIREANKQMNSSGHALGREMAAIELAKDPDPYALTLLEWALGDGNADVRAAVAKALAQRGTRDTIPKLEPLLNDSSDAVKCMAAAAIIRLSQK